MGFLILATPVFAKEEAVQVIEPFLEIHTGPGKSYPVFYVGEKGEDVFLLKRRTDWYKVRLRNGQEGWVHLLKIDLTLRASGFQKGWIERIYDKYISKRFMMGWGGGTFGGDPILMLRAAYSFTEVLALEGGVGMATGDLGGTDIFQGGLLITPWKGPWFSLYGAIGGGRVQASPTSLLINASNESFSTAYGGIGFSAPLFRRLFLRGDFRNFSLFINPKRTREVQEYTLGLSFGF
jgi:hypothetical protein